MKKGLETYLYTTVGVVAFLAILVGVNLIGSRAKVRVDLTADRAYTLNKGTLAILQKLDTPVQVRFYCTRGENRMPVFLKNYAQTVEDLLGEFRQKSNGQIEIQKLDPVPDSDAEDSAKLDGVEGQMTEIGGDPLYLGLSVTMLDQKEVIPFLSPDRAKLLEYDLARAISRVMTPSKPVVGVMSPLPYNGMGGNPMMMMQRNRSQPAWVFTSELKRDFEVKSVEMTADKIPDDVKVLLLIHPKAITDATQYAIDQFVLRGGKLIAFLDPLAVLDQAGAGPMGGGGSSSNMEKLLKNWGLSFDSTKVVADMNYISRTRGGRAPAVLSLTEKAVNKDDILTANADNLFLVFPGSFSGTPAEGLRMTTLVKSSTNSQLIDPMSAQMGGEQTIKDFKASGTEYNLAVRLSGKFKTAFPEGKPKAPEPKPEDGKPEEKKPDAPAEAGLKESAAENTIVLIGDSDFLQDQVSVQEAMNPFGGGQRMVVPVNGNLAFGQSAVEQLSGDSNLIEVRSRASRERPFTVVKQMQADAEAAYQTKIKDLETSLRDAQAKLNELQRAKTGEAGQRFILSPEQQAEIANFKKKEGEVKKQLKEERKRLRIGVESLETKTKWLNILVMPLVVAVAGLLLALKRRKLQAAR
ncbi:MAG: hypothetical protein RL088_2311 [Verrucomicrobiota bacterium]|jgi:ABC-type uncharacterized transport system involved in gliding motility auxiliary subunit